jgi:hypothetical protein
VGRNGSLPRDQGVSEVLCCSADVQVGGYRTRVQATTDGDALDRALDSVVATADTKGAVLQALG